MKIFKQRYRKVRENLPSSVLKHRNFFKFIVVGGSGTIVNMLFLWVFHDLFLVSLEVAGVVAIELSILNNFIWNNLWTFRKSTNRSTVYGRFAKYNISVIVGICINYGILIISTKFFGIYYLLSNLIGIGCATFCNYIISSRWTWKNEK